MPQVILVDFQDKEIGTMEKMEAHIQQRLHRAFSVFLVHKGKILLQKRASHKYHCGGLWTNTCCSHPAPGETVLEAAKRRLMEEIGVRLEKLQEIDTFFYRYPFENGITEFECDHVLVGDYHGSVVIDLEEVEDVRWISVEELQAELMNHAEAFTPWFLICASRVMEWMSKENRSTIGTE